jgi:OOP family OmpA-OmpF porin
MIRAVRGVIGVLVLAAALVAVTAGSTPAQDKVVEEIKAAYTGPVEVKVLPKVDNFIILVDESGSMFMTDQGKVEAKAKVAKQILAALNERIPELGYKGAVTVFSPDATLVGPATFKRDAFGQTIKRLPVEGEIYGNMTPLGNAIASLDPTLSSLSGRTAIIIVSDGAKNIGQDTLAAARALRAKYPEVCFDVISLADSQKGRETLSQVNQLGNCTYADGKELASSPAAIDKFAKDVFYSVEVKEVKKEVVEVPTAIQVPPPELSLKTVLFEFDKSTLTAAAKKNLDENIEILKAHPDVKVVVDGYTDSVGTSKYNQKLSEQRARTVADYLVKNGISPERVQTAGYGASRPAAPNTTPAERALNRRAQTIQQR